MASELPLFENTVANLARFLDAPAPSIDSSDIAETIPKFSSQMQRAFLIDKDRADEITRNVLTIGRHARNRDLIVALEPLGRHAGWPFFGLRRPHELLNFICEAKLAGYAALQRNIRPMPLFAMQKSGSSYSSEIMRDLMQVPLGIVSLDHLTAWSPWVEYISTFPLPLHDHTPPHPLNLRQLKKAGVCNVVVQVRDPRQLMVSQARHSAELNGNTDGSDATVARLGKDYAKWMRGWQDNAKTYGINVLVVRNEDMAADAHGFFRSILEFFNAPHGLFDRLDGAINRADAARLAGGLNYRKGRSDEWKEVLSPEQIATVTESCGPVFGNLYSF